MSIVYPLDAPVDFGGLATVELRTYNQTAISQSPFTFRQQTFRYPDQRWVMSVNVSAVRRDQGERWATFITALNGVQGTFLMGDPLAARPQGAANGMTFAAGFPRIAAPAGAGTRQIEVEGFTADTAKVFQAGDYIQLGSGVTTTLHMVTFDADSNAAGVAQLAIWPAVRRNVNLHELVIYVNPRGRFRLASRDVSFSRNSSGVYSVAFEAREAIP